jgi:hypothetical protein
MRATPGAPKRKTSSSTASATDLANPTSNAIYERIGYVRVCESAMVSFEPR